MTDLEGWKKELGENGIFDLNFWFNNMADD